MERFSFGEDVAFVPRGDLLERVTIAPLTQPFEAGALVQAAIFRFGPGGRLRRHPANMPEIFAVLEGSGEVGGASGVDVGELGLLVGDIGVSKLVHRADLLL